MSTPGFNGIAVALDTLLAARERRAAWQDSLRKAHSGTIIVLSVLTPGAIKHHPFSRSVFAAGVQLMNYLFPAPQAHYHWQEDGGEVAWWCVAGAADAIKRQLLHWEDTLPLGRLWDMDVIDADGKPLSRQALGFAPRRCLVCDDIAKVCARERRHSLDDVQAAMQQHWQAQRYATQLATHMSNALCAEALLTPKPGLVDMQNHDSHPDMPPALLLKSAQALIPHFAAMAIAGMNHAGQPDSALFAAIRPLGMAGERAMFATTNGVNTHKGAIFAFGLWAAVLGWQYLHARTESHTQAAAHIAHMCAGLMDELAALAAQPMQASDSAGVRLYREHGLGGARAQAAQGFPLIFSHALPVYRASHAQGYSAQQAWRLALLALIAENDDSTTASRGGVDALRWAQQQAQQLLHDAPSLNEHSFLKALLHFDELAARRRLSFGGSADLLALAMFLQEHANLATNPKKEDGFYPYHPVNAELLSLP